MNDRLSWFDFVTYSWVIEQLIVWLALTVAVSFGVNWWRKRQEKKEIEKYTGWTLVLLGDDDPGDHQSLHWEEVKRINSSDFERWKLVKSTVSGHGFLTVTKIKPAEQSGWTYMDESKRHLVVDFNNIPCEHLEKGQWKKAPRLLDDAAKCPAAAIQPQKGM